MLVVHPRCCGLDVHKKSVVACVVITHEDGSVERALRSFGTMTVDLMALCDWLEGWGVTHVALESTGVYWRRVSNVLEDATRTLVLVNAQHIKHVPGRTTDVNDAEWLTDLVLHGVLKPSFIPQPPFGCCANSRASARRWSRSGPARSTGCRSSSKGRT